MTRDEVMAMSGWELRIKAAELRGFKWLCAPHGGCRFLWFDESGLFNDVVRYSDGAEPVCDDACKFVPDYPSDIAAAWELVACMTPTYSFQLNCHRGPHGEPPWWYASALIWGADPHRLLWTEAETASRAITRAFVLAMTQESHRP